MTDNQKSYHLFLLAGQSNMAGRGTVADEDRQVHPQIMTLDQAEEWVPAVDPLHFDKPIAGVGPGRSFALAVAQADPAITIGLVPCAVGGSPISSWEPGAVDPATGWYPYDDAVRRARTAMDAGVFQAILWHQGESDAQPELAPVYKEKLLTLIARLRGELGKGLGDAKLPFLIGQLGQFDEKPWSEWKTMVHQAHVEIAEEVEAVAFVSSDGLGHGGDELHFSAEAARELGRRYAREYARKS